jgi:hypothetical protein
MDLQTLVLAGLYKNNGPGAIGEKINLVFRYELAGFGRWLALFVTRKS